MFLTSNYKYVFVHTRFNKLIGNTQCIYKSTALISNVKCTNFFHTHGSLYQYAAARKIIIGREGCKYDKVNLFSSSACSFDGYFCRFHRHSSSRFLSTVCIPSFLDTCSFNYPFVAGFHIGSEVLIGHYMRR